MKIDTTHLTEEAQIKFIAGWEAAGGYMDDCTGDNPSPWCCPWYHGNPVIEVTGKTPEAWGAAWWQQCRQEIEDFAAEEAAWEESDA